MSNKEGIKAGLRALFQKGDTIQVLVTDTPGPMTGRFAFDTSCSNALDALDGKGNCFYVLNPTALPLAKLQAGGEATKEHEVATRRSFLLDCDSVRDYIRDEAGNPKVFPVLNKNKEPLLDKAGNPRTTLKRHKIATDAEFAAALSAAREAKAWLESYGWTGITIASSGNGAHLLVPCYLPNDAESKRLVRAVQLACSLKFETAEGKVECFDDADRNVRAYGTLNMKGEETPERKHRRSGIIEAGIVPTPTPDYRSLMLRVAAENPIPELEAEHESGEGEGSCTREGLQALLDEWVKTVDGFEYQETNRRDGFQVMCPGNESEGWPDDADAAHDDIAGSLNDSTIVFVSDGMFCFSCRHNHCGTGAINGKKEWHDYRAAVEPPEDTGWADESNLNPDAPPVEKCASKAYCGCECGLEHLYPQSYLNETTRATIDAAEQTPEVPEIKVTSPNKGEFALTKGKVKKVVNRLIVRCATDFAMLQQKWMWPGIIPEAEVTLFAGPVAKGKSLAALAIVACVTRGRDWPDGSKNTMGPRRVLIGATEDRVETVIKPRLAALEADMSKIMFLVKVEEEGGTSHPFSLKKDAALLNQALKENPDIALVVLDPITGFYGDADGNANKDVRPLMEKVNKICHERGVTFIAIVHENKSKDVGAVNQVLGAGALTQVVRGGFRFSSDSDPEQPKGTKIMANIKTNLTKEGGGLRFQIEGKDVTVDDGSTTNVPVIIWGEKHGLSADDVMGSAADASAERKKVGRPPVKQAETIALIRAALVDGPRHSGELYALAEQAGINENTLKTVKQAMHTAKTLEYKKDGKGKWWTRMPEFPGTESQQMWWTDSAPWQLETVF